MNKFQKKFNKLELKITEEEVIEMLTFKNKVMEEYDIRELLHLVTPDLELEEPCGSIWLHMAFFVNPLVQNSNHLLEDLHRLNQLKDNIIDDNTLKRKHGKL